MRIRMARPSVSEAELKAVEEVLKSGWLGEGPKTKAFEEALADYMNAPHVVAVDTGTSALHLALEGLGVGPGDEVILPAFTFASDPMAVRLCGATPVFVDIDAETLNLNPNRIERHISDRTRVIMPTDYAGLPADVPAIRGILGDRDIFIVRDAAHSFGSSIDGRVVGAWCGEDATAFSFGPIKNLTCGEGGAILVNDSEVAKHLRQSRNLGLKQSSEGTEAGQIVKRQTVTQFGYRYHMSDLNAAIGLAQFERLPDIIEKKRVVARRYDALFANCPAVETFHRDYDEIVPFLYPVRIDAAERDGLIQHYGTNGVHADLRYSPCHWEPFFKIGNEELPETDLAAKEVLCLPIFADMKVDEVHEVVTLARGYLESSSPA